MDDAQFWSLIDLLDWDKTGDDDAVVAPVVASLEKLEPDAICAFESLMSAKLHALDTVAHAREVGEYSWEGPAGYFSNDGFVYARACALANGRESYEAALADPTQMPKDMEFEALLYVATTAFESRTGEEFTHVPELDYETGENKAGWAGVLD